MKWSNLKNMQCPTCSKPLKQNARMTGYKCDCGFFITTGKFEAVVNKIYTTNRRAIVEEDRNLSELNNL